MQWHSLMPQYSYAHFPTCLREDSQARCVGRNKFQKQRVNVDLQRCDGSQHAQVVHFEETITGEAVHPAGEAAGHQEVAMDIKIRQTTRVGIKLVLYSKSPKVTQRYLMGAKRYSMRAAYKELGRKINGIKWSG